MRRLFIINPTAGKSSAFKRAEELLKGVDESEKAYTEYPGHATELARGFAREKPGALIFALGGDGTLNEVISGVWDLDCSVAHVPTGSGNDFIRSLPAPRESFLDIEALTNGRDVEVDLIRVNDRISDNSVTVGFDCAVARNVEKFKKKRFLSASLAYKLSIFYCLFRERRHMLRVKADGREIGGGSCLLSLCAKGKYYGGGIQCAPKAVSDDGKLDFMYVPTVGVIKFLSLLPSFSKGKHLENPRADFIINRKADRVVYESDKPFDIGIDGEIITVDRAEISVLKKAQKIRIAD